MFVLQGQASRIAHLQVATMPLSFPRMARQPKDGAKVIEISGKKLEYQWRVNPFNPRCVDVRVNKIGARWEHYKSYMTTMEAVEALMKLSKERKGK